MDIKIFISYSHSDEAFKDELVEHLATLRRSGELVHWNDRDINAGDDWSREISAELAKADVILFLVSASFFNSTYCTEVEAEEAMKMHKEGRAVLIPIVVRPVVWNKTQLSNFQALPKNAKAVSTWTDSDSAWVDVVEGITLSISKLEKSTQLSIPTEDSLDLQLNAQFEKLLNQTAITLTKSTVDRVNLSDIYVNPDIELEAGINTISENIEIVGSDTLLAEKGNYFLLGDEQQGKSSLLKHQFVELLRRSVIPIYLDAKEIRESDVNKIVAKKLPQQYSNLKIEEFNSYPTKAILIDNFESLKLNAKYRNIFVESIVDKYDWVIITCHESYTFLRNELPSLAYFDVGDILCFGNVKREEIIKKWVSLGVEESIDEHHLYQQCDAIKTQLNTVIKKNLVPAKPIYVLMIMQVFEAYGQNNIELTSYGHCYQQLIYKSFSNAHVHTKNYEKYQNVLSELAWCIYTNGKDLNQYQLEQFFKDYQSKFLRVDSNSIIETLISGAILVQNDHLIGFRYPYIFYFFVAKKLAEAMAKSGELRSDAQRLLAMLHREDAANILIFITHHSRDTWVIEEIKRVLNALYSTNDKAELRKAQLTFVSEFVKQIPEIVIEQRVVAEERESQNKTLDALEREEPTDYEMDAELFSNINKTFKGMEIAGQIIRNRHASLTRTELLDLADSGIAAGLRFLDFFVTVSNSTRSQIMTVVDSNLAEHPDQSNTQIKDQAAKMYTHLIYTVISGTIRKIAASIGSQEAEEIYRELERREDTPAHALLRQCIELQYSRKLNISSVEKTAARLRNNPVCLRILNEIVVQHIYMFPVDYRVKQQLAECLNISVKGQELMDRKSRNKG